MSKPDFLKPPDANQLALRVTVLQEQIRRIQTMIGAARLAERTGSQYFPETNDTGQFSLELWQQPVRVHYPDWIMTDAQSGQSLPVFHQALLLYYFLTADGTRPESRWISFADLPDGRFYNQAFQGYTGSDLGRVFQNDLDAFTQVARRAGGQPVQAALEIPGDRAFVFQALPRLAVLTAYWQGDEDFPAAAQILFEITAPHYLPTDVCAILGSALTRRLIKHKGGLS